MKIECNQCFYVNGRSNHTHSNQESKYKEFKLEKTVKLRCENENNKPRDIFNEECALNQEAGDNLQYAKRYRNYKYHQSKGIPKDPKSLLEVKNFFDNEEVLKRFSETLNAQKPHKFYQETVITPYFGYIIFSSEAILNDLPEIRQIRIDGTFKCVPRGPFKQLLIISYDYSDHVSTKIRAKIIIFEYVLLETDLIGKFCLDFNFILSLKIESNKTKDNLYLYVSLQIFEIYFEIYHNYLIFHQIFSRSK